MFRVQGFQVWGLGYEVSRFGVSGWGFRGSGFLVLYSGFSRFGVSWLGVSSTAFRGLWFRVRCFGVRGFRGSCFLKSSLAYGVFVVRVF